MRPSPACSLRSLQESVLKAGHGILRSGTDFPLHHESLMRSSLNRVESAQVAPPSRWAKQACDHPRTIFHCIVVASCATCAVCSMAAYSSVVGSMIFRAMLSRPHTCSGRDRSFLEVLSPAGRLRLGGRLR